MQRQTIHITPSYYPYSDLERAIQCYGTHEEDYLLSRKVRSFSDYDYARIPALSDILSGKTYINPGDTEFSSSPDEGENCLCSRCGSAITQHAFRIWPRETCSEYRYHDYCIGLAPKPKSQTLEYEFPAMTEPEPEQRIDPETLKEQNRISRLKLESQMLEYGQTLLYVLMVSAIVLIIAFVWYCIKGLSAQTETIGRMGAEAAGWVLYGLIIVIGTIVCVALLVFFIPRLFRSQTEETEYRAPETSTAQKIEINVNQGSAPGGVQDLINNRTR